MAKAPPTALYTSTHRELDCTHSRVAAFRISASAHPLCAWVIHPFAVGADQSRLMRDAFASD